MEEKIYLTRKNISLPVFEAVKESDESSEEEQNPIPFVKKLFQENLFKHILHGKSVRIRSQKAEYITAEQILDSAMSIRSMMKGIKAKHPEENFVILVGDGQLNKVRPIFEEYDFKTLKTNGVNYLLFEQAHDASSISKHHLPDKDPKVLINEFIEEINTIIKNKFDKDVIRKFIAIGQKALIGKETKAENDTNYIDSLKYYKTAAEQAGMKVKFINISVNDEFQYNLTLALQEGIIQTKVKYIYDEQSHVKLSNFNFALSKINEHLNYLKHGYAGKFITIP